MEKNLKKTMKTPVVPVLIALAFTTVSCIKKAPDAVIKPENIQSEEILKTGSTSTFGTSYANGTGAAYGRGVTGSGYLPPDNSSSKNKTTKSSKSSRSKSSRRKSSRRNW